MTLLSQIAKLPKLSMPELQALWRDISPDKMPTIKTQLIAKLAYALQERALGGLAPATTRKLDQLAHALEQGIRLTTENKPVTGTVLIREWNGIKHEVTVLKQGYAWQGRTFGSLSAAARAITGTRWNGPLFFGLRRAA
jgi:Protein of unknown function (DUF2924)